MGTSSAEQQTTKQNTIPRDQLTGKLKELECQLLCEQQARKALENRIQDKEEEIKTLKLEIDPLKQTNQRLRSILKSGQNAHTETKSVLEENERLLERMKKEHRVLLEENGRLSEEVDKTGSEVKEQKEEETKLRRKMDEPLWLIQEEWLQRAREVRILFRCALPEQISLCMTNEDSGATYPIKHMIWDYVQIVRNGSYGSETQKEKEEMSRSEQINYFWIPEEFVFCSSCVGVR